MNDKFNQNISPLTNYEFQNQDDKGFSSQTLQSLGISSQNVYESLHGDKDENNISVSWHGGTVYKFHQLMHHCTSNSITTRITLHVPPTNL